jgi:hypothetical protein
MIDAPSGGRHRPGGHCVSHVGRIEDLHKVWWKCPMLFASRMAASRLDRFRKSHIFILSLFVSVALANSAVIRIDENCFRNC